MSSTLTRQTGVNKVPDYREYMNFVSAYKNGKKEPDSAGQEIIDSKVKHFEVTLPREKSCESYSNFLEKTKGKKFGSVKPPIASRDALDSVPARKTVKTEIFLHINNHSNDQKTNGLREMRPFVENVNDKLESSNKGVTRTVSVVEAKKKIFENKNYDHDNKTVVSSRIKNYIDTENTYLGDKRNKFEILIKDNTQIQRTSDNLNVSPIQQQTLTSETSIPIQDDKLTTNESELNEKIHVEPLKSEASMTENTTINVLNTENIPTSPPLQKKLNPACPPPPPPLPIGLLTETSTISQSVPKRNYVLQTNVPVAPNNFTRRQKPEAHISRSSSTCGTSTLDRKDPLVRKLAYGAMLDMYGAYHDKANSYVATLPKNQVRKENALQKIIDNIAAQGGLEKLCGRSNPKAENE